MLAGLSCCWPVGKREDGKKWLARPFMLPQRGDPGKMASVILIRRNILIRTPTAKAIPAQNNNLKFFLLQVKPEINVRKKFKELSHFFLDEKCDKL